MLAWYRPQSITARGASSRTSTRPGRVSSRGVADKARHRRLGIVVLVVEVVGGPELSGKTRSIVREV